MKPEYAEWIRACEERNGGPIGTMGRCHEEAEAMVSAFPELTLVRGHAVCMGIGLRGHWWCETPDGEIVDPTRGQFQGTLVDYEPYEEGMDIRLGKCMNCGSEIWGPESLGRKSFCDAACGDAFGAWLEGR